MQKQNELEPISESTLAEADARHKARVNSPLFVTHAAIDVWQGALLLRLRSNIEIRIPISDIKEMARTPIELLQKVKPTATGGIFFEDADIAIDTNGLLRDLLGTLSSPAKARSARTNGQRGGRPRKQAA